MTKSRWSHYETYSDEALSLEIAKREGWVVKDCPSWINPGSHRLMWYLPEHGFEGEHPSYATDVSVIWELEDKIPEDNRGDYTVLLRALISSTTDHAVTAWEFAHATPRQRCIAWLVWQDEKSKEAINKQQLTSNSPWTPVNINPINNETSYLVTIRGRVKDMTHEYVQIRFYRAHGEWNDPNVVAWMPLPLPY
jgi:hypothetical protein